MADKSRTQTQINNDLWTAYRNVQDACERLFNTPATDFLEEYYKRNKALNEALCFLRETIDMDNEKNMVRGKHGWRFEANTAAMLQIDRDARRIRAHIADVKNRLYPAPVAASPEADSPVAASSEAATQG